MVETIEALAEMPDGVYVNAGHLAVITTARTRIHWLTPPSLRSGWGARRSTDAQTDEDSNVRGCSERHPSHWPRPCARGASTWYSAAPPGVQAAARPHWPGASATSLATMPRPRCTYLGDELDIRSVRRERKPMAAMERLFRYAS